METTYISAAEAARITGLSQRRINQLVKEKKLPGLRIGNSNAIESGPELSKLRRLQRKKQKND